MIELGDPADTVGKPQIMQEHVVGRVMEVTIEDMRGRSLTVKPALAVHRLHARPLWKAVEVWVCHKCGDRRAFVSFGRRFYDHVLIPLLSY